MSSDDGHDGDSPERRGFSGLASLEDEHEVAGVDAEFAQGVPRNVHHERGLRVPHEDVVEIQPGDATVPRRRAEPDGHAGTRGSGVGVSAPAHPDKVWRVCICTLHWT